MDYLLSIASDGAGSLSRLINLIEKTQWLLLDDLFRLVLATCKLFFPTSKTLYASMPDVTWTWFKPAKQRSENRVRKKSIEGANRIIVALSKNTLLSNVLLTYRWPKSKTAYFQCGVSKFLLFGQKKENFIASV